MTCVIVYSMVALDYNNGILMPPIHLVRKHTILTLTGLIFLLASVLISSKRIKLRKIELLHSVAI